MLRSASKTAAVAEHAESVGVAYEAATFATVDTLVEMLNKLAIDDLRQLEETEESAVKARISERLKTLFGLSRTESEHQAHEMYEAVMREAGSGAIAFTLFEKGAGAARASCWRVVRAFLLSDNLSS